MSQPRKHWYFITHHECLECAGETFRERRYGRRPKRWENRHEYVHDGICYRCSYEMFMGG